jgi:hypothetical protein
MARFRRANKIARKSIQTPTSLIINKITNLHQAFFFSPGTHCGQLEISEIRHHIVLAALLCCLHGAQLPAARTVATKNRAWA